MRRMGRREGGRRYGRGGQEREAKGVEGWRDCGRDEQTDGRRGKRGKEEITT